MKPQGFRVDQPGWTVEVLNQTMQEQTGTLISDKSLRDVLHRLGYTFQLVRPKGNLSSLQLPKTAAEFVRYMEQVRQQPATQRNFRTWVKAE
jgi:hypothetical protein